jgi:hypothetical protein
MKKRFNCFGKNRLRNLAKTETEKSKSWKENK